MCDSHFLPPGQASSDDETYSESDALLHPDVVPGQPYPATETPNGSICINPAFEGVMNTFIYWTNNVLPFQYSLSMYKNMPHLLNEVLFTNQSAVSSMCGKLPITAIAMTNLA